MRIELLGFSGNTDGGAGGVGSLMQLLQRGAGLNSGEQNPGAVRIGVPSQTANGYINRADSRNAGQNLA